MIESLPAAVAVAAVDDLATLLIDAVDGGASVSFVPPLDRDRALTWWCDTLAAASSSWVAMTFDSDSGRLRGTSRFQ